MKHRIRSAAIIIDSEKRILLVKHHYQKQQIDHWVPPGGKLEDGEDIFDNAVRETKEESGLEIMPDKVIYLREFVDKEHDFHNLEIFIKVKSFSGEVTIKNLRINDKDSVIIRDAKFFSRKELEKLTVFPEIIKTDEFWDDEKNGFPEFKYLGQQIFEF